MSILDNLLGGNNGDSSGTNENASDNNHTFAANPALDFAASNILHSESMNQDNGGSHGDGGDMNSNEFTGIGAIGLDVASPIYASNDSQNYSNSETQQDNHSDGGLLSGLL